MVEAAPVKGTGAVGDTGELALLAGGEPVPLGFIVGTAGPVTPGPAGPVGADGDTVTVEMMTLGTQVLTVMTLVTGLLTPVCADWVEEPGKMVVGADLVDMLETWVSTDMLEVLGTCVSADLVDMLETWVSTDLVDVLETCVSTDLVDMLETWVSTDLLELLGTWVSADLVEVLLTGHTVVETAMMLVLTMVDEAGQEVTVGGQLVTVMTLVE